VGYPAREVGVWQRISHFLRYRRRSGQHSELDVYPFVPEILAWLRMVGEGQVRLHWA
jgi:hypothetical protein